MGFAAGRSTKARPETHLAHIMGMLGWDVKSFRGQGRDLHNVKSDGI